MQPALNLDFVTTQAALEQKTRIGQTAGAHHVGLGDPQFSEIRLQAAIVEERNLHRIISRQGFGQQLGHAFGNPTLLALGARPFDVLANFFPGDAFHRKKAPIARE